MRARCNINKDRKELFGINELLFQTLNTWGVTGCIRSGICLEFQIYFPLIYSSIRFFGSANWVNSTILTPLLKKVFVSILSFLRSRDFQNRQGHRKLAYYRMTWFSTHHDGSWSFSFINACRSISPLEGHSLPACRSFKESKGRKIKVD